MMLWEDFQTFSKFAAWLISVCTEIFWIPAITLSSFFPDWEHSGCVPLDGCRENSFAGSRNVQLLVSRQNMSGILVFPLQVHSLTVWYSWASQAKKPCSVGLENWTLETATNPTWSFIWSWFHWRTFWMLRLDVYPECCGQWSSPWAPVTCRDQTRCGPAKVTLHRVFGHSATGALCLCLTWSMPDLVTCSTADVQSMCTLLNKYHFVSIRFSQSTLFQLCPSCRRTEITGYRIKTCLDCTLLPVLPEHLWNQRMNFHLGSILSYMAVVVWSWYGRLKSLPCCFFIFQNQPHSKCMDIGEY